MSPEVFVKSCESVFQLSSFRVSELEGNGHGCCDDVATAKSEEEEGQGRHLPGHLVH